MKKPFFFAALSTAICGFVGAFGALAQGQESVEQPKQALTAVPFVDVHLTDNYWAPRIETNRVVSVPHNIKWCEDETRRIDNFKATGAFLKDGTQGKFEGIYFDDSDVYKIIEGFAYSLAAHPDAELQKKADEWITHIGGAQEDDGYLMCYFTLDKPNEKWTNLAYMHELYCAGHMAEAAVAYQRSTGDDKFVKINRALLDLICKRYGPGPGQLKNVPGHQEIELALVKMYQLTGERKYLDQAKFFIDIRGVKEGREKGLYGEYCQDHKPVRDQEEIVGHAVRAMYLYCGATDVAGYFRDAELLASMERVYNNLTRNKMYITGGIGSSASNEGFEENFKLPNKTSYCETCASIGMTFWTHRLNLATGKAKYVDTMERAMYNGFTSGYGLNGDSYFYVNPLASDGNHHRQPFFGCACCPSNVIRALPSVPGYVYATASSKDDGNDDIIVANMFVQGSAKIELADKFVEISQTTNYPYCGDVKFEVKTQMKDADAEKTPFVLKVRVPSWSGAEADENGYRSFVVEPQDAATVEVSFDMPVVRTIANPNVKDDAGRVALQRGPLVYCFEQVDNDVKVDRIILAQDPEFKVEMRENYISDENVNDATKGFASRSVAVITCKDAFGRELTAVPYCVWDNRAAGKMAVWVRQAGLDAEPSADSELGKAENWTDADGLPILYKALDANLLTDEAPNMDDYVDFTASFSADAYSTFTPETQDATTPKNSCDHDVPRATFWDRKGTAEWFQYEFFNARKLSTSSVYWFDDTGRGQCRVPKSWKLTYQAPGSDEWREVETTDAYSVERDKEIVVNFKEIEAERIRLEIQLQENVSGGILKWKVK